MTRVTYTDAWTYQELTLSGHAERERPDGSAPVCTGISAISQTLWENLYREQLHGKVRAEGEMETPGEMRIRAYTTAENREAIRNMFRFTVTGLQMIEERYPDNIRIEEEKQHGSI